MTQAELEAQSLRRTVNSYEALTTRIMQSVEEAFPGERFSDYDVLHEGVARLARERALLRKALDDLLWHTPYVEEHERAPWIKAARAALEAITAKGRTTL